MRETLSAEQTAAASEARQVQRPAGGVPDGVGDGRERLETPATASAGFDWAGLMRAGLVGLGLSPRTFWDLTPVELLIMLGIEGGPPPLSRARLEQLAARFPDRVKGQDDGGDRGSGRADRSAGGRAGRGTGDGGGI